MFKCFGEASFLRYFLSVIQSLVNYYFFGKVANVQVVLFVPADRVAESFTATVRDWKSQKKIRKFQKKEKEGESRKKDKKGESLRNIARGPSVLSL